MVEERTLPSQVLNGASGLIKELVAGFTSELSNRICSSGPYSVSVAVTTTASPVCIQEAASTTESVSEEPVGFTGHSTTPKS
jgi:hypothetical protein